MRLKTGLLTDHVGSGVSAAVHEFLQPVWLGCQSCVSMLHCLHCAAPTMAQKLRKVVHILVFATLPLHKRSTWGSVWIRMMGSDILFNLKGRLWLQLRVNT